MAFPYQTAIILRWMLCCLVIFCVRNVYFCEFYEKKWYRIISEVN